ncbi:general secretion pathway protein GspK [Colwellia sp. MEBiC06753]
MPLTNRNLFQQGIALIQVLIISIILSMLAIYISQTVRTQVGAAGLTQDYHYSVIAIESAESELLHYLLTEEHYKIALNNQYREQQSSNDQDNTQSNIRERWNFYGQAFELTPQVNASIQDITGLLSLNHLNRRVAERLFEELGKDDESIRIFLDSLADWKDKDDLKHLNGAESQYYAKTLGYGPRNGYLQSFDEIAHIRGGEILTIDQFKRYFSLSLISSFNPLNAPDLLLKSFINDDLNYEQTTNRREQADLNGLSFFQVTGIDEDDFISFRTGRIFSVVLSTATTSNNLQKSFIVEIRPNSQKRPVIISETLWNNS